MSFVTTQLLDILHEASPIISLRLSLAQVYRHDSYDIGYQSEVTIAIDLLPSLPFSRHIPKLNAVLRTRVLVGGKFVVASVVLHAGDTCSALLLLAATPKEEGSNQEQANTGNRSNDDTGDGTTAKFLRASRLCVELGRTVGRAGAAGTLGGAGAIRVAGAIGVCPPGGG